MFKSVEPVSRAARSAPVAKQIAHNGSLSFLYEQQNAADKISSVSA
ncbi:MAG: hypothetical protein ACJ72J_12085 [Nitrososphaeraceae archaeon]